MISANPLQALLRFIPKGRSLTRLLTMALLVALGTGAVLLVALVILPNLNAMNEKMAQLATAKQDLVAAEQQRELDLQRLKLQAQTAQDILASKRDMFMSRAQAAAALDSLYLYANQSGAEIANFQSMPGPQREEASLYDVETFRLLARGSLPALLEFLGQIKEISAYKTFLLTNVSIAPDGDTHLLTMEITLYTSWEATGEPLIHLVSMGRRASPGLASVSATTPVPAQGTSAANPYLVKPTNWPTDWPWPPKAQGTPAAPAISDQS